MIWRSRLFAPLMLWPPLVLSRPRRKSKIILHIGLHKTATSSFQTTLRRNDFRLARRGIYDPLTGANPRRHGLARRWASSMSERAEPPGGAYATWKRLNRRFTGLVCELSRNSAREDLAERPVLRLPGGLPFRRFGHACFRPDARAAVQVGAHAGTCCARHVKVHRP